MLRRVLLLLPRVIPRLRRVLLLLPRVIPVCAESSLFPFHCWSVMSSPVINSRFTVGHYLRPVLLPVPASLLVLSFISFSRFTVGHS